jgi:hypothetical protein
VSVATTAGVRVGGHDPRRDAVRDQGPSRILVIGATGNVGRRVVPQLATTDQQVRALTRKPHVARLPPQVEVVQGDLTLESQARATVQSRSAELFIVDALPAGVAAQTLEDHQARWRSAKGYCVPCGEGCLRSRFPIGISTIRGPFPDPGQSTLPLNSATLLTLRAARYWAVDATVAYKSRHTMEQIVIANTKAIVGIPEPAPPLQTSHAPTLTTRVMRSSGSRRASEGYETTDIPAEVRSRYGNRCRSRTVSSQLQPWPGVSRVPILDEPCPPPAVRRRDRRRADGDARGAEGAAARVCAVPLGGGRTIPPSSRNVG